MDDSSAVRFGETVADLRHDIDGLLYVDRPFANPLRQSVAFVVGHHEIELAVGGFVDFVNGADVDVVQRRRRPGFVKKALLGSLVPCGVAGQNLDRNLALETGVASPVDDPHSTAAKPGEDFIGTQPGPGSDAHARAGL